MRCHQGRFGQFLVRARDFDLLLVLEGLFQRVLGYGEILQLRIQLFLQSVANLVRTLCDDSHGLIHVAHGLHQTIHVAGNRVLRCIGVLVIHIFCRFNKFPVSDFKFHVRLVKVTALETKHFSLETLFAIYSFVIFFTSRRILSAAVRCFEFGYSVMKL